MPDISKINALAIGSVGKVDGLAKASILDIDGVAVPLAIATPAVAYSVRLLGSALGVPSYTGDCMRVRRASDNVEADIAFDAGELKLTSGVSNTSDAQSYTDFADFVDHTGTPTDALVRWWYDQSGNSIDAGQSTASAQPQIYDATTGLITENGKPIISRVSSSTGFSSIAVDMSGSTISMTSVSKISVGNSIMVWFGSNLNERLFTSTSGSSINDGGQAGFSTTSAELFFNGSSQGQQVTRGEAYTQFNNNQTLGTWVGLTDLAATTLNFSQNGGFWQMHDMQEIVFWESDQSTNRTDIENNINGFFSVYP